MVRVVSGDGGLARGRRWLLPPEKKPPKRRRRKIVTIVIGAFAGWLPPTRACGTSVSGRTSSFRSGAEENRFCRSEQYKNGFRFAGGHYDHLPVACG